MSAVLRTAIVVLALATAYIHFALGSMMFLANAAGYLVLAAAMAVPLDFIARNRWLVRAALAGFTATTILGWVMFGARFDLAYVDKAIEIVLIALLVVEMFRYDGGPLNVLRRIVGMGVAFIRLPFGRRGEA